MKLISSLLSALLILGPDAAWAAAFRPIMGETSSVSAPKISAPIIAPQVLPLPRTGEGWGEGVSAIAPLTSILFPRGGEVLIKTAPARAKATLAPLQAAARAQERDQAAAYRAAFDEGAALRGSVAADGPGAGLGIRPSAEPPAAGIRFDPRPAMASEITSGFGFKRGQLMETRGLFTWLADKWMGRSPERPILLAGDPSTAEEVEAALAAHIRANRALYGNVNPDELALDDATLTPGRNGLADAFYVSYRQRKNGLDVQGTFLTFTVKKVLGRTAILGSSGRLVPTPVDTTPRLSSDELLSRAAGRLGVPPASVGGLNEIDRRVMELGGKWRAVQVYMTGRKPILLAVDLATGESFVWDARVSALPKTDASANVSGRGIFFDPEKTGENLPSMPMLNAKVTAGGKTYYADAQGNVTIDGEGKEPVEVTATISGRYFYGQSQKGTDLTITQSVVPGTPTKLLFQPQGYDESATALVTAYVHANRALELVKSHGVWSKAFETPLVFYTDEGDECNAFFDYRSLNFFSSSPRCRNTALPDVAAHETGHYIHYKKGGIKHGGLSEGHGDILAMILTGSPIIGMGFFLSGSRQYIRNGDNDYQYDPGDEVHQQGLAWMGGFRELWKSVGLELAAALTVPVFNAAPVDIVAAANEIVLRDVDEHGNAPHFAQIEAAFAKHGITVTMPRFDFHVPAAPASLARRMATAAARWFSGPDDDEFN